MVSSGLWQEMITDSFLLVSSCALNCPPLLWHSVISVTIESFSLSNIAALITAKMQNSRDKVNHNAYIGLGMVIGIFRYLINVFCYFLSESVLVFFNL